MHRGQWVPAMRAQLTPVFPIPPASSSIDAPCRDDAGALAGQSGHVFPLTNACHPTNAWCRADSGASNARDGYLAHEAMSTASFGLPFPAFDTPLPGHPQHGQGLRASGMPVVASSISLLLSQPLQSQASGVATIKVLCPEFKELLLDLRAHLDEQFQLQRKLLEQLVPDVFAKVDGEVIARAVCEETSSGTQCPDKSVCAIQVCSMGIAASPASDDAKQRITASATEDSLPSTPLGPRTTVLAPGVPMLNAKDAFTVKPAQDGPPHAETAHLSSCEFKRQVSPFAEDSHVSMSAKSISQRSSTSRRGNTVKRLSSTSKPSGRSSGIIVLPDDEEWVDGQTWWTVFQRKVNRIVKHTYFDYGTGLAIVLNTIMLGIQVDVKARQLSSASGTEEPVFFSAVETMFCIFFLTELVLRLIACQADFFFNWWHLLDVVIVIGALVEEFIKYCVGSDTSLGKLVMIRMLKVAKILRSMRILRVFRAFREIRKVLFAIIGCLKSLFWVCCVLLVVTYFVTLLILIELTSKDTVFQGDTEFAQARKKYFSTFLRSLLSMYQATTGGLYWEMLCSALEDVMPWVSILWIFYAGFVLFAITNTVTGIFVDHAMASATDDFRNAALEDAEHRDAKFNTLRQLLVQAMDRQGCGVLTRESIAQLCKDEGAKKVLSHLNIDPRDIFAFFELVAGAELEIEVDDIDTFALGCFRLRGFASSMSVAAVHYSSRVFAKSD